MHKIEIIMFVYGKHLNCIFYIIVIFFTFIYNINNENENAKIHMMSLTVLKTLNTLTLIPPLLVITDAN